MFCILHFLQVVAAFVVVGAFAMHTFFKPYRKLYQNVIEILVLLNYFFLLLLRSTQTFLDNASSSGYTGTAVPDFSKSSLPDYDSVIWLFLPFFYGPLVFAAVFFLGTPVYRIIKSLINRRRRKDVDIGIDIGVDTSYVMGSHGITGVTRTEIDI